MGIYKNNGIINKTLNPIDGIRIMRYTGDINYVSLVQ